MLRRSNVDPQFGPVAACLLLLVVMTWGPHWFVAALPDLAQTFALCVLLLMAIRAIRFREAGTHLPSLGAEVLTVAYVGLLLCLTASMRWMGPGGNGYLLLGSLIFATKMGDVGAYTLGRLFGKRKMSPHLSPGKTWMGAGGAVLGGILGAGAVAASGERLVWFRHRWHRVAVHDVFGAVMGVVGLIGDLCESLIKRDAGVKDSAASDARLRRPARSTRQHPVCRPGRAADVARGLNHRA